MAGDWVEMGVIGAPQGLKGEVRVKSFTAEPDALGTLQSSFETWAPKLMGVRLVAHNIATERTILRRIAPLTLEDRARIPGLYPERAAMMPHGLCILSAAMDLTGFDRITLSTRNNLDAILAREAKRETSSHP